MPALLMVSQTSTAALGGATSQHVACPRPLAVRPMGAVHHRHSMVSACPQQQRQRACVAQLQQLNHYYQQQQQQQQRPQPSWLVRSSPVSSSGSSGAPEGQVSAAIMEAMQAKIKEELQADSVVVADVYGDGRHVNIDVISSAFEGKNSVQRQRMVYKAIWLELQETVHAVDAMTTKTPQEAA